MSDTAGAQEAVVEHQENQQPQETPDEIVARRLGWKPRTEYHGPADKFVEAPDFIRKGNEELPVLRQNFRVLNERFTGLENHLKEQTKLFDELREFSSKGEERAYQKALKEITDKQKAAVDHADRVAYDEAERERAELEKTKPKPPPAQDERQRQQAVPQVNPEIIAWVSANPWYNSDPTLARYARAQDQFYTEEMPGLALGDRLAQIKADCQAKFPDKFGNTRREAPNAVAAPNGSGTVQRTKPNAHVYENLPAEAKRQCDKYVAQFKNSKTPYTRDEYCRDYDWEG